MRAQIDRWMREEQNYAPQMRAIAAAAAKDPTIRTYARKDALKRHRERCLKLPSLLSSNAGSSPEFRPAPPPSEEEVSYEQIYKDARRHLSSKLAELSAKELHTLVIEGMKLRRAELAPAAKSKPEGDDEGDDDAIAEMQRAKMRLA